MGEFFKGWRRKVGVLTLGLALAFYGLWFRTNYFVDDISFSIGERRHSIFSGLGGVIWDSQDQKHWRPVWTTEKIYYFLASFEPPPDTLKEVAEGRLAISYWTFIVPLTLLSAALLLWPQRKPKP